MPEDPTEVLRRQLEPDRNWFGRDPFGYSGLAWHRWCILQELAGLPVDPEKPPTSADLKAPALWLAQAHAMSHAAVTVLSQEPRWERMPIPMRGICDSQHCATGLMLLGYSLEICLKAMLIITHGVQSYSENERGFRHHRLDELASFMPNLSEKDLAVLRLLTQYLKWAGRYPDPGSGRENDAEQIFTLSEKHQIAAKDLFELANRVVKHVSTLPELR